MYATNHRLHRILSRFPWRRRKPRGHEGAPAVSMTTREGQRLWADLLDLAHFQDPGPALICIALHTDQTGHVLVRALVEHQARERGIELPTEVPVMTLIGLQLLDKLISEAGVTLEESVGEHSVKDLIEATWAIAAGAHGQEGQEATSV